MNIQNYDYPVVGKTFPETYSSRSRLERARPLYRNLNPILYPGEEHWEHIQGRKAIPNGAFEEPNQYAYRSRINDRDIPEICPSGQLTPYSIYSGQYGRRDGHFHRQDSRYAATQAYPLQFKYSRVNLRDQRGKQFYSPFNVEWVPRINGSGIEQDIPSYPTAGNIARTASSEMIAAAPDEGKRKQHEHDTIPNEVPCSVHGECGHIHGDESEFHRRCPWPEPLEERYDQRFRQFEQNRFPNSCRRDQRFYQKLPLASNTFENRSRIKFVHTPTGNYVLEDDPKRGTVIIRSQNINVDQNPEWTAHISNADNQRMSQKGGSQIEIQIHSSFEDEHEKNDHPGHARYHQPEESMNWHPDTISPSRIPEPYSQSGPMGPYPQNYLSREPYEVAKSGINFNIPQQIPDEVCTDPCYEALKRSGRGIDKIEYCCMIGKKACSSPYSHKFHPSKFELLHQD